MYYQIAEQINEIYIETFIENYTGSFQIIGHFKDCGTKYDDLFCKVFIWVHLKNVRSRKVWPLKKGPGMKSPASKGTAAKSPEYKRYGVLKVRLQNVRIPFCQIQQ